MKPLKFGLVALVALLAIAVVYGIGNADDGGSGADEPAVAAESGDTSTGATGAESTDGGGATAGGGNGEGGDNGDGGGNGDGDGDGGGSAAAAGAPLTKAAYVKSADAICEKVPLAYTQNLRALEEETKGNKKPPVAEVNLKAAVPPLYTAIKELEGLGPPSGEEQQVEAIIDALGSAAKGLEAKPSSELSGPKSPFAEFQKLSRAYGLQVCSQL